MGLAKMQKKLSLLGAQFSKESLMLLILSVASSGVNYIFQILMGNLLTVGDFGTVNSLISASANISIIFSPLTFLICNYAVEYVNSKNKYRISAALLEVLCIIVFLGGASIVILNIARDVFPGTAAGESAILWNVVLVSTILSSAFSVLLGIFQGLQKFLIYGSFGAVQNLVKIPLSVLGALSPAPVQGVLLAILFTNMLCVGIQLGILARYKFFKIDHSVLQNFVPLKEVVQCYGSTFLVQLASSFFFNGGDIILTRYAFSEETAGLFASALLLGKIPMYVVSVFAVMLLPKVSLLQKEQRDSRGLMVRIAAISFLLTVAMCVGLYVVGLRFIVLVFGAKYQAVDSLLGPVCFYVVPLIMNYLLTYYVIAINYTKVYTISMIAILMSGIAATIGLVQNIETMLYLFAILLWGGFAINLLLAFKRVGGDLYEK